MRVRVHQHVNPLAPYYRQAPKPVDLDAVFVDPTRPLHLDIGSARGRFLLRMAEAESTWNLLGVEIREPLVHEANRIAAQRRSGNLHYVFCNAMLWLDQLIENVPEGILQMVTIHFPDPWFKKKHAKRRMVNAELVETVASKLAFNGRIFVQTDIGPLAEEMFELFEEDRRLIKAAVPDSPFSIKTEREQAVELKGLPVFRRMYKKKGPE